MKKIEFPMIGQRIIRSVTGVILCFIIYYLRGQKGAPFYSAIAVLQCVQSYTESTYKMAKTRLRGTIIGAIWGLIVILVNVYMFPQIQDMGLVNHIIIAICCGLVIYTTVVLGCKENAYFSCVVFLSITVNHINDAIPLIFVWDRVLDTVIGVVLAVIVNVVHLPRKKNNDILFISGIDDTILTSEEKLTNFSKVELNRMIEQGANFTVATTRTPASIMDAMPGVNLRLPVVTMDGAALYDICENRYIKKYEMSPYNAGRIKDYLDERNIFYFSNVIIDDLLIIYYQNLNNEASKDTFRTMQRSPYRNYVKGALPENSSVVYFFIEDEEARIDNLHEKLMAQEWIRHYRIVKDRSVYYEGFSYIKIYSRYATRENMIRYLMKHISIEKKITFGSIPGKYDVCIEQSDHNEMVKEMLRLYEPVVFLK